MQLELEKKKLRFLVDATDLKLIRSPFELMPLIITIYREFIEICFQLLSRKMFKFGQKLNYLFLYSRHVMAGDCGTTMNYSQLCYEFLYEI